MKLATLYTPLESPFGLVPIICSLVLKGLPSANSGSLLKRFEIRASGSFAQMDKIKCISYIAIQF